MANKNTVLAARCPRFASREMNDLTVIFFTLSRLLQEGLIPGVAAADALAATLMSQVIALKGADAVEHMKVHGREAVVGSGGARENSWCVAPTQKGALPPFHPSNLNLSTLPSQ